VHGFLYLDQETLSNLKRENRLKNNDLNHKNKCEHKIFNFYIIRVPKGEEQKYDIENF
jgi:hypothetical protein